MLKILFLIISVCSVCFSKTYMVKNGKNVDWGKNAKLIDKIRTRALTCKNGAFSGQVELFGIFEPIIEDCLRGLDNQDKFLFAKAGICMMNTIGLMDSEGAPDAERMEAIFNVVYSPELLQHVPELIHGFHLCTKAYFEDYDNAIAIGKKEDVYESFLIYNSCIDSSTAKLSHSITKVCATLNSK
ncbi:unnamed protein product [Allacma fusca]|uniref:Uncharacterized protein n=1 Tax=Allacma fusca TaxID=39272 RepID=A0A8J2K507_9HEXA|nr:unnamed protein product [Allacma fusca]